MSNQRTRSAALVAAAALLLGAAGALGIAAVAAPTGAGAAPAVPRSAPTSVVAATDTKDPRTVTGTGTGRVKGKPDTMTLQLGVSTRGKSAGEALSRNSDEARKLQFVLGASGVDDADIQTSDFSISPVYDDDSRQVVAYEVTNSVTVTIRDLDKVGDIVDKSTGVAGDDIVVNGLYFSIDDNSKMIATARAEAVKQAKSQATQLAQAAGIQLGDVLSITESSDPVGPPIAVQNERGAADSATAAPPIQPGSQELSVQVSIVYEIG